MILMYFNRNLFNNSFEATNKECLMLMLHVFCPDCRMHMINSYIRRSTHCCLLVLIEKFQYYEPLNYFL